MYLLILWWTVLLQTLGEQNAAFQQRNHAQMTYCGLRWVHIFWIVKSMFPEIHCWKIISFKGFNLEKLQEWRVTMASISEALYILEHLNFAFEQRIDFVLSNVLARSFLFSFLQKERKKENNYYVKHLNYLPYLVMRGIYSSRFLLRGGTVV